MTSHAKGSSPGSYRFRFFLPAFAPIILAFGATVLSLPSRSWGQAYDLSLMVRAGDNYPPADPLPSPGIAPLYSPEYYEALGAPSLNNQGTVAFHGFAWLSFYNGLFTDDGPGGRVVAGEFWNLSDLVGYYEWSSSFPSVFYVGSSALNDSSQVVFFANVYSFSASKGIFLDTNGPDITVASDAQTAPSTAGGLYTSLDVRPSLNNAGQVSFSSTVTNGSVAGGVFLYSGGAGTAAVSLQGEAAPGTSGGTYDTFSSTFLNDAGAIAFRSTVTGGSATEGLFLASGGTDTAVALQGEAATGTGGGAYASFGAPSLNGSGAVAFRATIAGGTPGEGLFIDAGGIDMVVALQGQDAPGTGGGLFGTFGAVSINDDGSVAFSATMTGGSAASGIFVYDASTMAIHAVALAGQAAPGIEGATFSALYGASLNDLGQVAFVAALSDGSSSAIYRAQAVPEPASLLLVAAGASFAARRRKRRP